VRKPNRQALSESAGFTLVEMLVAMTIATVVIGAAVMVFTAGVRNQPRIETQAHAITSGRTTMERIVRELRQGSGPVAGTTPSASSISIVTYVDSTCAGVPSSVAAQCSVSYTCANGTCTRRVAQPNGSSPGAAVTVVSGLSSNNVFSCSPSCSAPTYVGVTLTFPGANGSNALTLSDGAAFRNKLGGS
jgi:prepilin-type N-terminal cleavage/methylation domain-containing protein